jgi:hypothetical protein
MQNGSAIMLSKKIKPPAMLISPDADITGGVT